MSSRALFQSVQSRWVPYLPGSLCREEAGSGEPAVRAFKSHLAEYHLPDEVIEGYATILRHDGKFILVRTHPRERTKLSGSLGNAVPRG
jgi:hypothetical protein